MAAVALLQRLLDAGGSLHVDVAATAPDARAELSVQLRTALDTSNVTAFAAVLALPDLEQQLTALVEAAEAARGGAAPSVVCAHPCATRPGSAA